MTIDIILTVMQVVVGLLLAGVGIEMANNPPQTTKQKWIYRSVFIVLGIFATGITLGQAVKASRDQQEAKRIGDNERQVAQQDRLERVKEVGNLQGQLQSMQQVLGHVLSNSDPKQTISILRSMSSPLIDTRSALEKMSNKVLKAKVLEFVGRMSEWSKQMHNAESAMWERSMNEMRSGTPADKTAQIEMMNKQSNQYMQFSNVFADDFRTQFAGAANNYREELLRRIGPEPIKREIGSRPLALEGWVTTIGVDETIVYMDRLARKLPD
jgi:hypothetical protein